MKKIFLLVSFWGFSLMMSAQDDMYFKPTKSNVSKQNEKVTGENRTERWNGYKTKEYSDDEIDRYNRQGYYINEDTLYLGDGQASSYDNQKIQEQEDYNTYDYDDEDYCYSRQLARFHNPSINITLGWVAPYYYDPFYDSYWDFYGRSWYYGYYNNWYRPWYYYAGWYPYRWGWWGAYPYWRPTRYYVYHGPTGTRFHSRDWRNTETNKPNSMRQYGERRSPNYTYGSFGSRTKSSANNVGQPQQRNGRTIYPQTERNTNNSQWGGARTSIPNNMPSSRSSMPTMRQSPSLGGGSFGGARSGGGSFGGRR